MQKFCMKKLRLDLIASSLLLVVIQLLGIPLILTVWGDVPLIQVSITSSVYLGFLLGMLFHENLKKFERWIFLLLALLSFFLACFYPEMIVHSAKSASGRILLAAFYFFTVIISSHKLISALYKKSELNHHSYFWQNLLSVFSIVLFSLIAIKLGHPVLYFGISAIFLCAFFSPSAEEKAFEEKLTVTRESKITLGLGILSALFISDWFERINILFRPNGLEYPYYLFLVFIFLTFSQKIPLLKKRYSLLLKIFILISLFITALSFTMKALPLNFFVFWGPLFFFLPYLPLATLIPTREKESPGNFHFFWCTLGNTLGFFLYIIVFRHLSLNYIFFAQILFASFLLRFSEGKKIYKTIIFVCVGFFLLFFRGIDLEKNFIHLSFAAERHAADPIEFISYTKVDGTVGFLLKSGFNQRRWLGIGGYHAVLDSSKEIQQTLWVQKAFPKGFKRALVLGIGGNQVIATLASLNAQQSTTNDWQIDAIDNSSIYQDEAFRHDVGTKQFLDWKDSHINYIYDDAFTYVMKSKLAGQYDIIIWNLTWPVYGPSNKLYTKEFIKKSSELLSPNGFYSGYLDALFMQDNKLGCLFQNSFPGFTTYPGSRKNVVWLAQNENKLPLNISSIITFDCSKTSIPTLSHPFWINPFQLSDKHNFDSSNRLYAQIGSWEKGNNLQSTSYPSKLALASAHIKIPVWFDTPSAGQGASLYLEKNNQNEVYDITPPLELPFEIQQRILRVLPLDPYAKKYSEQEKLRAKDFVTFFQFLKKKSWKIIGEPRRNDSDLKSKMLYKKLAINFYKGSASADGYFIWAANLQEFNHIVEKLKLQSLPKIWLNPLLESDFIFSENDLKNVSANTWIISHWFSFVEEKNSGSCEFTNEFFKKYHATPSRASWQGYNFLEKNPSISSLKFLLAGKEHSILTLNGKNNVKLCNPGNPIRISIAFSSK